MDKEVAIPVSLNPNANIRLKDYEEITRLRAEVESCRYDKSDAHKWRTYTMDKSRAELAEKLVKAEAALVDATLELKALHHAIQYGRGKKSVAVVIQALAERDAAIARTFAIVEALQIPNPRGFLDLDLDAALLIIRAIQKQAEDYPKEKVRADKLRKAIEFVIKHNQGGNYKDLLVMKEALAEDSQ